MAYPLLVPPTSCPRGELTRKAAQEYFRWFVDQIPQRISVLQRAVQLSARDEYQSWSADRSSASLETLGAWLGEHVETEPVSEDFLQEWSREVAKVDEKYRMMFEAPERILTNRTLSLVHDVAMYLGEVLREHFPVLEWQLWTKGKRSVDFQEPVLVAPGMNYGVNPVRLVHTIALRFARGKGSASALTDVFEFWVAKLEKDMPR